MALSLVQNGMNILFGDFRMSYWLCFLIGVAIYAVAVLVATVYTKQQQRNAAAGKVDKR